MNITADQNTLLTDILSDLSSDMSVLNNREKDFVQQTMERHEQYGANIMLSPKQWKWLTDIHERVTGQAADIVDVEDDDEIPF